MNKNSNAASSVPTRNRFRSPLAAIPIVIMLILSMGMFWTPFDRVMQSKLALLWERAPTRQVVVIDRAKEVTLSSLSDQRVDLAKIVNRLVEIGAARIIITDALDTPTAEDSRLARALCRAKAKPIIVVPAEYGFSDDEDADPSIVRQTRIRITAPLEVFASCGTIAHHAQTVVGSAGGPIISPPGTTKDGTVIPGAARVAADWDGSRLAVADNMLRKQSIARFSAQNLYASSPPLGVAGKIAVVGPADMLSSAINQNGVFGPDPSPADFARAIDSVLNGTATIHLEEIFAEVFLVIALAGYWLLRRQLFGLRTAWILIGTYTGFMIALIPLGVELPYFNIIFTLFAAGNAGRLQRALQRGAVEGMRYNAYSGLPNLVALLDQKSASSLVGVTLELRDRPTSAETGRLARSVAEHLRDLGLSKSAFHVEINQLHFRMKARQAIKLATTLRSDALRHWIQAAGFAPSRGTESSDELLHRSSRALTRAAYLNVPFATDRRRERLKQVPTSDNVVALNRPTAVVDLQDRRIVGHELTVVGGIHNSVMFLKDVAEAILARNTHPFEALWVKIEAAFIDSSGNTQKLCHSVETLSDAGVIPTVIVSGLVGSGGVQGLREIHLRQLRSAGARIALADFGAFDFKLQDLQTVSAVELRMSEEFRFSIDDESHELLKAAKALGDTMARDLFVPGIGSEALAEDIRTLGIRFGTGAGAIALAKRELEKRVEPVSS